MAENVYEILVQEWPALMETLNTNEDVSAYLMSVYSTLLYHAIEDSRNPADLRCAVSIQGDRLLVIKTHYAGSDARKADIGTKLPRQRNLNLVKFLQVNVSVRQLALNVVYELERWLQGEEYLKEQGFKNIKTYNPMRWKEDGTITVELVMKFQFDEYVSAKMKWEMEDVKDERRIQ